MSISAINCSPIKPKVSFAGSEEITNNVDLDKIKDSTDKFDKATSSVDSIQNKVRSTGDLKSPLVATGSVALSIAKTFLVGAGFATSISFLFPNLASKSVNLLRKGADLVKTQAKNMQASPEVQTKLSKVKVSAGKLLGKAEDVLRTGYKKFAYAGMNAGASQAQKDVMAFKKLMGAGAVACGVPSVFVKDKNGNKIPDVVESTKSYADKLEENFSSVTGMATAAIKAQRLADECFNVETIADAVADVAG